jgi:hypothetical protein
LNRITLSRSMGAKFGGPVLTSMPGKRVGREIQARGCG